MKFWNVGKKENLSFPVSFVVPGEILLYRIGYIRVGGVTLKKEVISRYSIKFEFS
jgi:hypothetical protein